jgi:hypothetical protein
MTVPRRRAGSPGRRRGGGRPGLAEVLVATGRDLTATEALLAQLSALAVAVLLIWLLLASGALALLASEFGRWYAGQIHTPASPGP